MNGTKLENESCYAELYDLFAVRYGYNLEQFYALTLRQIFYLKRIIENRMIEEKTFQAKLHGKELKAPPKPLNINPERRKEFDEQAMQLHARLKKKYGERSRIINKD